MKKTQHCPGLFLSGAFYRAAVVLCCILALLCCAGALAEGDLKLAGDTEYTWIILQDEPDFGRVDLTLATFTCAEWEGIAGDESFAATQTGGPSELAVKTFNLGGGDEFQINLDGSPITIAGDYTFRLDIEKDGRKGSAAFTVHAVNKPVPEAGETPSQLLPVGRAYTVSTADVRKRLGSWAEGVPVRIDRFWFGGDDYDRDRHFDWAFENNDVLTVTPKTGTAVTLWLTCRAGCNYVFEMGYGITVTDAEGNILPGILEVYSDETASYEMYPADSPWYDSYVTSFYVINADELSTLEPGSGLAAGKCSVDWVSGPEAPELVINTEPREPDYGWISLKDGQAFTRTGDYTYRYTLQWGESAKPAAGEFTVQVTEGTSPSDVKLILPENLGSGTVIESDYCTVVQGDFCRFEPDDWRGNAIVGVTDFIPDDPAQERYINQEAYDTVLPVSFLASGDYPGTLYVHVSGFGYYHCPVTFHVDVSKDLCVLPEDTKVIRQEAFANCTSMHIVIVPDGCERIESGAFRDCYDLLWASVPAGCEIAEDAFEGCNWMLRIDRR